MQDDLTKEALLTDLKVGIEKRIVTGKQIGRAHV